MPQLAIETYFSQYFWLLVIFFIFNDFILHKFIPSVSKILKIRKLSSNSDIDSKLSSLNNFESNLNLNLDFTGSLLSFNNSCVNEGKLKWYKVNI
jgi:hypothetical protein